jgi:TrmH family RNA methyltransferase
LLSNPRAERVRSVRQLSGRSARTRTRRFLAEGPQAVREAVAAHAAAVAAGAVPVVLDVYTTAEASDRHPGILATARTASLQPRLATAEVMAAMTATVTPQGMLAVCSCVDVPLPAALQAAPALVAVLARVRDPGNAGTVVRAADAAGAETVVLSDASVDVHNPKCVRASAGSLFHLPVVTGVRLADTVPALRAAGLSVLAADTAGDRDLDELLDAAAAGGSGGLAGPVAWLFGNEAWGLPAEDLALADAVVRVPVHGRAESLNLATAATVCLYASARAQRRGAGVRVPDDPGPRPVG